MVHANEEAAVAQAILILNSDAAFESFGATAAETSGNTGFILLRKSTTVRRQVRHLLENLAKETDESYHEKTKDTEFLELRHTELREDGQGLTRRPLTAEPGRGADPARDAHAFCDASNLKVITSTAFIIKPTAPSERRITLGGGLSGRPRPQIMRERERLVANM